MRGGVGAHGDFAGYWCAVILSLSGVLPVAGGAGKRSRGRTMVLPAPAFGLLSGG